MAAFEREALLKNNDLTRRRTADAWRAIIEDARQSTVKFEVHGWDVYLYCRYFPTLAIELKPIMGDDYPAVLRALRMRIDHGVRDERFPRPKAIALVIDHFEADGASLDDVKWIFGQRGIKVRTLTEIRDAAELC